MEDKKQQQIVQSVSEANKLAEEGWQIIDVKCYLLNTTTALRFPQGYSFSNSDLYVGGTEERLFIILEKNINKI